MSKKVLKAKALLNPSVESREHNGKVFLGGTCNDSTWRGKLIPLLNTSVEVFNPVVENWSLETQQTEEHEKRAALLNLYVLTPKQTGFYSFSELAVSAMKDPEHTVVTVLNDDEGVEWDEKQKASIDAVEKLLKDEANITVLHSLDETARVINEKIEPKPEETP